MRVRCDVEDVTISWSPGSKQRKCLLMLPQQFDFGFAAQLSQKDLAELLKDTHGLSGALAETQ